MFNLSTAYWRSCCIYTAAKLGIPDLLAAGARNAAVIAGHTGCNADAVYRLMRALASMGVFQENEEDGFELTPVGATLTSYHPDSMRAWVLSMLGERFIPWGELQYSVRTGRPSFEYVHQAPVWQYYNEHPQLHENFIRAMESHTRPVIRNVLAAFDFSCFPVIADIGGGNGALLCAVLESAPGSRGILFDQPGVIAAASKRIAGLAAGKRCTLEPGSFFDALPGGADCYIMKNILHDWHDAEAVQILENCRRAMHNSSRLLLLEAVIPGRNSPHPGKLMDINMLVVQGGRERTEEEFSRLALAAGLQHAGTRHTGSPECSIIELVKAT